jgi:hypothetical protein
VIDEAHPLLAPTPEPAPPPPRPPPPPPGVLSLGQLQAVAEALKAVAAAEAAAAPAPAGGSPAAGPAGFITCQAATEVLLALAAQGARRGSRPWLNQRRPVCSLPQAGQPHPLLLLSVPASLPGGLPGEWATLEPARLLEAVQSFDAALTGYVDWRQLAVSLLAASCPRLHAAAPPAIARAAAALTAADGGGRGWLREEEWGAALLWFTEPTPAERFAAEEAEEAAARGGGGLAAHPPEAAAAPGAALKRLLWTLFAAPPPRELGLPEQQPEAAATGSAPAGSAAPTDPAAPRLPWEPALLYLCLDRDLGRGLSKAIAAVTRDGGNCAAASPEQVVRLAWPLLGPEAATPLQGAPLSAEQVVAAARAVAGGSSGGGARAAALLSSAACERVAALLLGRYRLTDVYIRCRL